MDKLKEDIKKFLIDNKDNESALRDNLTNYCLHGELNKRTLKDKPRTQELKLQREAVWAYCTNIIDMLKELELPDTSSYRFALTCLKCDMDYILSDHDITQCSELLGNINTKFGDSDKFSSLFY